jgi:hypothetical protein
VGSTRRERSFEDVHGAAKRFLRALAVRVGEADEFELGELVALREELDEAIVDAIRRQLQMGKSWQSIGDGLGTTRQAAFKRYASRVEAA